MGCVLGLFLEPLGLPNGLGTEDLSLPFFESFKAVLSSYNLSAFMICWQPIIEDFFVTVSTSDKFRKLTELITLLLVEE